jgi:hypothetical protein
VKVAAGLALLAVGACLAVPPAAADEGEPVDRVLVLSLPTLGWDDIGPELTNLDALFAESAVADLSTRILDPQTSPGSGYATVSAGTRAEGVLEVDGLAFAPDERYGVDPAGEVFTRRTGEPAGDGLVVLGLPQLRAHNEDLQFEAEIGALGDALGDADVRTAVIANADRREVGEGWILGRQAVTALAAGPGRVDGGRTDRQLLRDDPAAPSGVRLDLDEVEEAFADSWGSRSVVLVEASDLTRVDLDRRALTSEQRAETFRQALESTDELVGRLLEHVDPATDAVVVVGPYDRSRSSHLTIASLRAPGVEPALLDSAVTRRAGFVTLADVGPTVLDLLGAERPDSMEGRPFQVRDVPARVDDRLDYLAEEDAAAQFRDRLVGTVSVVLVVSQLVLWPVAIRARRRQSMGWYAGVRWLALVVLGLLPASYLAGLLPFHDQGDLAYWLFLLAVAIALGTACHLLLRRHPSDALLGALTLLVGLFAIDLVTGAHLQFNTVFGYTPTIAGRFAGIGNLAFAQLGAAALVLAVLVAWRIGGRAGRWAALAILVVAIVLDGAPWWGSDVGGVLALVPAAGLLFMALRDRRIGALAVAGWAGAAVICVLVAGAVDLSRPEAERTHLARLIERVRDGGVDALATVIQRKSVANLTVLSSSVWTILTPLAIGLFLYLLWRTPGRLAVVRERLPHYGALVLSFTVLATLGFALNDSGIAVPGVMLSVVNASLVYLLATFESPVLDPAVGAPAQGAGARTAPS